MTGTLTKRLFITYATHKLNVSIDIILYWPWGRHLFHFSKPFVHTPIILHVNPWFCLLFTSYVRFALVWENIISWYERHHQIRIIVIFTWDDLPSGYFYSSYILLLSLKCTIRATIYELYLWTFTSIHY